MKKNNKKNPIKRRAILAQSAPMLDHLTELDSDSSAEDADINRILKIDKVSKQLYANKLARPPRGRTSLLTPQRELVILKAVRKGLSASRAAELAGISGDTLNSWKKKGNVALRRGEKENIYAQFVQNLRKNSAHAELANVAIISDAAEGGAKVVEITKTKAKNPVTGVYELVETKTKTRKTLPNYKAALDLISRRYPDRWGRDTRAGSGAVATDPAEFVRLIQKEFMRLDRSIPDSDIEKEEM
jgi:DNA-binding CsgD family transcriptional regulator